MGEDAFNEEEDATVIANSVMQSTKERATDAERRIANIGDRFGLN